jgi:hypothetical protein
MQKCDEEKQMVLLVPLFFHKDKQCDNNIKKFILLDS